MSETIEIVRFTVPPERAGELVAGHDAARRAIDDVGPGWIWSRLARFDERSWVEVVAWDERDAFLRALERSAQQPIATAWFGLADPGWTLRIGARTGGDADRPPSAGRLELGATSDREGRWCATVELEGRTWTDDDAWRPSPPASVRITVADLGSGAAIEHACDPAAAEAPTA